MSMRTPCPHCGSNYCVCPAGTSALHARVRALEAALREAKEVIKVLHNMDMPPHVVDELWRIYDTGSPEMKRLNAALAGAIT